MPQYSTKYRRGDEVWFVHTAISDKYTDCPSCNGKGGACIPGTKVWVTCQECDGSKTVRDGETEDYHVIGGKVEAIEIEDNWRTTSITYQIQLYHTIDKFSCKENNVFTSKSSAEARMKELEQSARSGQ